MQAGYSIQNKSYHHDIEIAASLLSKEKKQPTEVKQILKAQGRTEGEVNSIVEIAQSEISEAKEDAQYRDKIYGGTICLLALLVTVLSINFSGISLGYLPAYLAVLYGAFRFLRGFRA